ncbi:Uncharacterised protein [Segatella copri]|nr:Uncharacterised protein [Segatella copri]
MFLRRPPKDFSSIGLTFKPYFFSSISSIPLRIEYVFSKL